ncbi:unnamed protein product [Ixodes pacificus]
MTFPSKTDILQSHSSCQHTLYKNAFKNQYHDDDDNQFPTWCPHRQQPFKSQSALLGSEEDRNGTHSCPSGEVVSERSARIRAMAYCEPRHSAQPVLLEKIEISFFRKVHKDPCYGLSFVSLNDFLPDCPAAVVVFEGLT